MLYISQFLHLEYLQFYSLSITLDKRKYEKCRLMAYPKQPPFSGAVIQQLKKDLAYQGESMKYVTSPLYDSVLIICGSPESKKTILIKLDTVNPRLSANICTP